MCEGVGGAGGGLEGWTDAHTNGRKRASERSERAERAGLTTIDYGAGIRDTNNPFRPRPLPTPLPSYINRAGVHSSFGGCIGRKRDISALLSWSIL